MTMAAAKATATTTTAALVVVMVAAAATMLTARATRVDYSWNVSSLPATMKLSTRKEPWMRRLVKST